jgi:hypothetical protein
LYSVALPATGLHSRWSGLAQPIERCLLDTPDIRIDWRCVAPLAWAEVDLAGKRAIRGLGYVEQLVLKLRHWRLPFDEIRWGRFLSSDSVLVWIQWLGRTARQWVFLNGREVGGATLTAKGMKLPSSRGALVLGDGVLVRDG